jgi:hypothetical protein
VLVAVFFLAVIISGMMVSVSRTITSLNRARLDIEASDLAQEQLRGVALAAKQGTLPEEGTTEGSFEGDEDLRFELKVEAYDVPLDPKDRELAKRSSVFGASESDVPGTAEAGPSVRRVTLRVYRASEGVESALPLTMFVTKPAEVPEGAAAGSGANDGTQVDDGTGTGAENVNRGSGNNRGNRNRNRNRRGGQSGDASTQPTDNGGQSVLPGPEPQ